MLDRLIIVILCILGIYFACKEDKQYKDKNNNLEKFGMFTIGRVVQYDRKNYGQAGSSPEIKFSYLVHGKYYLAESDYSVPNENGPQEGSFFMAIYLPNNPQIGILLLDYPVKSAGDFNKYMEEFKIKHPRIQNPLP